jgi:hypothetical protein
MPILFVAGLPRSSTLGIADKLYRCMDFNNRPALMTGHLHLAAALSGDELSNFHSPLHLYHSREALVRALLVLHEMSVSLEGYDTILRHYFLPNGGLNSVRFFSMLNSYDPLIIDPSFSHSIQPNLIRNLPSVITDTSLLVVWRNPIDFCLDLMEGVYGFDSCLQLILANSSLSFPLDPLALWLEFVRPYFELLQQPPISLKHVMQIPREQFSADAISNFCLNISAEYNSDYRPSALANTMPLFSECPYSGDPSYYFKDSNTSPMDIHLERLIRFSNQDLVIQDVIDLASRIGYNIIR